MCCCDSGHRKSAAEAFVNGLESCYNRVTYGIQRSSSRCLVPTGWIIVRPPHGGGSPEPPELYFAGLLVALQGGLCLLPAAEFAQHLERGAFMRSDANFRLSECQSRP